MKVQSVLSTIIHYLLFTMNQKLVVLGDAKTALGSALMESFEQASSLTEASKGDASVDKSQILFIDSGFEGNKIDSSDQVTAALRSGTPIVINEPSSDLLLSLSGLGVDGAEAALIVKGKRNAYFVKTYMGEGEQAETITNATLSKSEPPQGEEEAPSENDIESETVPEDTDSTTLVMKDLSELSSIDEKLNQMRALKTADDSLPENRHWSTFWEMDWLNKVLSDPSGEKKKTQTARFRFTTIFDLLAANTPVKKKVFNSIVGGTGFEPVKSDESMIRNDNKHRGWAQSVTYIEFNPQDNKFGNIQDYVPVNSADDVSITAGYSWSIGFTGGGSGKGPEGSVSFSYSQDSSHTISTKDFRTLAKSVGNAGLRFYHNTHVVGGDTIVDPLGFGFDGSSGFTKEMEKMFYYHFPDGDRVRSWPSLSRELLKPDSSCIWYADSNQNGVGKIDIKAFQGLNYFYSKFPYNNCSHTSQSKKATVSIDFSKANYDDPS